MANLGQLHVLRNWSSLLRLITPCTCCTMRRINCVFGSLVDINWTSSRSGIHTFPLRARLTKSTLDPKNTITLTGWVSIIQQGGGISPGSSSWTLTQLALLREMPLPYACFHGWVFDWNQRWKSLLRPPCFISQPWMRCRTANSSNWAECIWKWTLLLLPQRHCEITSLSWFVCAIWGIALRRCLPFSANSCRGSLCRGFATSWIWCYHNSPQSVPPGRMLLGPYGLVTIFVLSHMRMDICMSHGSQLLTSLRHMTISTTCGYSGAHCRSSCFQIRVWSIRWMYMTSKAKRYIDCINSISN